MMSTMMILSKKIKKTNKTTTTKTTTTTMITMITEIGISSIINQTILSITIMLIIIIGNLFQIISINDSFKLTSTINCDQIYNYNDDSNNNNNNHYKRLIINQPNTNESLMASEHYNRILKYAKCQYPHAKIINIQNELQINPSATKKYIPHCTILHYCGENSGCCRLETEHCIPKTIEEVKLYFWTIEITSRGQHKKGIEIITMKNHTECMCAPINQKSSPSSSLSSSLIKNDHNQNGHGYNRSSSSHHFNHYQQQQQQQQHRFEPVTSSAQMTTTPTIMLLKQRTTLLAKLIMTNNNNNSIQPTT
uniref:Probable serine/threonine-protein kinase MARK-A n=1 Tax=Dermatophagoides pteronyssinus TaxID=6956 RepID=A0A6P6YGR3_DERPT|nr:probable serine/threonine-protein kinase MARK-A [Dermatophagoides pteronyssinus]